MMVVASQLAKWIVRTLPDEIPKTDIDFGLFDGGEEWGLKNVK